MTNATGQGRFTDLLAVRLGLVLGLALLPVGMIAVLQSANLIAKAREQSEAALAGETLRSVRPQLAEIKRAQGAAQMLAALVSAGADCATGLAALDAGGQFGFVALYGTDGALRCATQNAPAFLPQSPAAGRVLTEAIPTFEVIRATDGTPIPSVFVPVTRTDTSVSAIVTVGVQPTPPDRYSDDALPARFTLLVLDATGAILSASVAADGARDLLPMDRELPDLIAAATGSATFTAAAPDGSKRSYALVTMIEGELYALGTWPEERPELSVLRSLPPLLLPGLMWAISLVVAWFAAETFVARHIRRLRSAILAFADGSRNVSDLEMQSAPQEIRETAEAFARMTAAILRDEAELEDALHGKEVLLREVHHRVKNNLQLIASIVNMQIRRTRSEEARRIMRSLQERMLSLATIHNGLYQTADISEIRVDRLFPGIVEQIVRAAGAQGRAVRLGTRFGDFALSLDQAVPLALLVTEALSNALRFAATDNGDPPSLQVSLVAESPTSALLEITNDAAGQPAVAAELGEGSCGIGTQLLRGFTRQLGGQFHRDFANGKCQVRVWFALRAPATAA